MPAVTADIDEQNILHGPTMSTPIPESSLGHFCYNMLKNHDTENVLMVEAESGQECTVGQFLDLCMRSSVGLRKIGLKEGDTVCLIGENKIDPNVAALAILFMGGKVAPLDHTMKPFEYQHMFNLLEPALIIHDLSIKSVIDSTLLEMGINIETIVMNIAEFAENDDELTTLASLQTYEISEEDFEVYDTNDSTNEVSIIVPSSGSTGLPKGVALTHRNMIYQLSRGTETLKDVSSTTLLHTSYFFWISSMYLFFQSIASGIKRILLADVTEITVLEAIDKYKPIWSFLAPSVLGSCLNHPQFNDFDTTSLKIILTGGSPLPKATAEQAQASFSQKLIIAQAYGMSELCGTPTGFGLEDIEGVGTLLPESSLKIIDPETDEILPPNTNGELCFKSQGLMKGYVNNDVATKEAIDEEGWLHTGDIGYFTPSGVIYITGRIKELMKLDNHQIAPAEIEHVIRSLSNVIDVAVAGIKISADSSHPMALVVRKPGSELSEEEIVQVVNDNLSEFKQLKAGVCFVDYIPRTVTGKIKRKDLQILADELYLGDSECIL